MICNKCGNKIDDGSKFCTKCGEPVSDTMITNLPKQKSKKKIIIPIIIVLILLVIIIISFALSNSKNNDTYIDDYQYSDDYNIDYENEDINQEDENSENISDETEIVENPLSVNISSDGYVDDYVNDYVNEVTLLKSYSSTSCELNPCYDNTESETGFILLWKNANEIIPKIKKDSIVGIVDSYEEINLVPIGSENPKYMVPLNFGDDPTGDDVDDFPDNLGGNGLTFAYPSDNIDFDSGDLLNPGNPLVECNNEDLTKFVNSNCDSFVYSANFSLYRGYKVVTGDKNQEFTFGGYVGTQWQEFTSKACVEYYKIYANKNGEKITKTIPTEKTKDGYFKVDFSSIDSGIYYVSTYNTFIELV